MALTITPGDIPCPATDARKSALIAYIDNTIGECLVNSYGLELANQIAIELICHFINLANGTYNKTGTRSPNGASTTLSDAFRKDGLMLTPHGQFVQQMDINGCWTALVQQSVFMVSVGQSNKPRNGDCGYVIPD